jgi:type IV pilus assembly protein PilB
MALSQSKLREALVESGGISEEQFKDAVNAPSADEVGVANVLIGRGILRDDQFGQLMATWYGVPFMNLRNEHISEDVLSLIPESFARSHKILPVKMKEDKLVVATSEPDDVVLQSMLEKYLRMEISFVYTTPNDIDAHLHVFRRDPKQAFRAIVDQGDRGEIDTGEMVVELVEAIIEYAYQGGASDIHIEPEEEYTVVRFREDGILHDIAELEKSLHEPLLIRLKVLARLATDEHRRPQDGKISYETEYGEEVEIRLSVVPSTQDQKAVMRLLTEKSRQFSIADLGLHPDDYQTINELIQNPWGMILVTGPTGSGKTTSLYSMIKVLNKREVNITTIEDPVEYDLEGVTQIQVNESADLTFKNGLRSIVRQDPDIMMVGEIRDVATADIALNAAMTGHLVFSTLHTNDAATAFPRLAHMEAEPFLISSTLLGVVAQRLARRVCRGCIQSTELNEAEKTAIDNAPVVKEYLEEILDVKDVTKSTFYKGSGCQACNMTGYKGRVGVFEILEVNDPIRAAVMQGKNADEIRDVAVEEGMTTMLYDGLRKVVTGLTTLQEVMRVVGEEGIQ